MTQIDNYIIDRVQYIYDYFWDYFGMTKGIVLIVIKFLCAFLIFIDADTSTFWRYFWVIAFIYSAYVTYKNTYLPQIKSMYKKLNKSALEARTGDMQRTKLYCIFPVSGCFILYNLSVSNYNYAAVILLIDMSTYVVTILVKDREPKDFLANPQLDY